MNFTYFSISVCMHQVLKIWGFQHLFVTSSNVMARRYFVPIFLLSDAHTVGERSKLVPKLQFFLCTRYVSNPSLRHNVTLGLRQYHSLFCKKHKLNLRIGLYLHGTNLLQCFLSLNKI